MQRKSPISDSFVLCLIRDDFKQVGRIGVFLFCFVHDAVPAFLQQAGGVDLSAAQHKGGVRAEIADEEAGLHGDVTLWAHRIHLL